MSFNELFSNVSANNFQSVASCSLIKGRYTDIPILFDVNFPQYNANLIQHPDRSHILLEGPALHSPDHCTRFLQVLINRKIPATDVIVAGDPCDGRNEKRGFFNYFTPDNELHQDDKHARATLAHVMRLSSRKIKTAGNITTFELSIDHDDMSNQLRVHHISGFADQHAMSMNVETIKRLERIFATAKILALHCSAGIGRTGVLELAYCLAAKYEHFYPADEPDFQRIQLQLETLRMLRPNLVQTAEQYRMAIHLGMQLYAARHKLLSDKVSKEIRCVIDNAAANMYKLCNDDAAHKELVKFKH